MLKKKGRVSSAGREEDSERTAQQGKRNAAKKTGTMITHDTP